MAAEDLQSGSSTLTKPPLSPSPFTQNGNPKYSALRKALSSDQKTPMWEQKSLRRSPRFLENGEESDGKYTEEEDFKEPKKRPAKKQPPPTKQITSELPSKKAKRFKTMSFLIGDPVPDEEARKRWPWRYDGKHSRRKGLKPNNDDDEDELILNAKCNYYHAQVENCVFDLGDCAYVKGDL